MFQSLHRLGEIIGHDICEHPIPCFVCLLTELLDSSCKMNWEVAFVFPLFPAHYLLLSGPSKLVRVLGQQLKFSVTALAVSSVTNGRRRRTPVAPRRLLRGRRGLLQGEEHLISGRGRPAGRTDGHLSLSCSDSSAAHKSSQALLINGAESQRGYFNINNVL